MPTPQRSKGWTVKAHEINKASQNDMSCRNRAGSRRSIGSVSKTNQNVDWERVTIASLLPVSSQSHVKARSETSGSERIKAPRVGLRLATSEAAAMIAPDRSAFVMA